LKESFAPQQMMSVHKMFAGVILVFTGLHIIGCFAAYENSGNKWNNNLVDFIPFQSGC
jgi:hypothetical protein